MRSNVTWTTASGRSEFDDYTSRKPRVLLANVIPVTVSSVITGAVSSLRPSPVKCTADTITCRPKTKPIQNDEDGSNALTDEKCHRDVIVSVVLTDEKCHRDVIVSVVLTDEKCHRDVIVSVGLTCRIQRFSAPAQAEV
ncbi:hypothetical protein Btru_023933 [Bulinus truncatus]|nr:hypothetical protein Btru_023933 [Bulinus truncatus]